MEMRKVLAIDGGGVRGIIPAMVLAEIEKQTGKPIAELFDLVVGTSTGGILALGLVAPDRKKERNFKSEEGGGMHCPGEVILCISI